MTRRTDTAPGTSSTSQTAGTRRAPERLAHLLAPYRDLVSSSSALTLQSAIMAVTGAIFWIVAARQYSADAVGEAGGLFTVTIVGNYATSLGLPIVTARHATSRGARSGSIFTVSLVLATVSSAAAAVVVAAVASDDFLAPLLAHGRLEGGLLFFIAVNGLSCAAIVDNRLIGLGLRRSFLVRHSILGLGRLGLVTVALIGPDALWIWLATTVGALLSIVVALVVQRRELGPYRIAPVADWREVTRFGAANFVSALLATAPFVILPLIVFAEVDSETNAAFHVAWSIAAMVFLVPTILSRSLLIRAGQAADLVMRQTRASVMVSMLVALAMLAVAIPASFTLPWIYGGAYERSSGYLLTMLVALVPYALTANGISLARIRGDTAATLLLATTLALAVVVPTALSAPRTGASGAASSWLGGHVIAGIVAAWYLRSVWRSRDGDPSGEAAVST